MNGYDDQHISMMDWWVDGGRTSPTSCARVRRWRGESSVVYRAISRPHYTPLRVLSDLIIAVMTRSDTVTPHTAQERSRRAATRRLSLQAAPFLQAATIHHSITINDHQTPQDPGPSIAQRGPRQYADAAAAANLTGGQSADKSAPCPGARQARDCGATGAPRLVI